MDNNEIIVLDIDGTLINERNEEIINLNKLFNFIIKNEMKYLFATGRSLLDYKKLNDLQTTEPVILLDGNLIYFKDKILCIFIKYKLFQTVIKYLISIPIMHIYAETLNKIYCTNYQDKILFIKNFKMNRDEIRIISINELCTLEINRIYIWNASQSLFENFSLYKDLIINIESNWTFINQIPVGKGTAIEWLKHNFYDNNTYVYSVGNGHNDVSLFSKSNYSILVNSNLMFYHTDIYVRKLTDFNLDIVMKKILQNSLYKNDNYD